MKRKMINYPVKKSSIPLTPLWKYDQYDRSTWMYSDCIIHYDLDAKISGVSWILNKDFKFKHLSKGVF